MKFNTTVDKANLKLIVPCNNLRAIVMENTDGTYELHTVSSSPYCADLLAQQLRKIYVCKTFHVFSRKGSTITEH